MFRAVIAMKYELRGNDEIKFVNFVTGFGALCFRKMDFISYI